MNEEDRLRKKLLRGAAKVIDAYVGEATGKRQAAENSDKHQQAILNAVVPIIQAAPPRQPVGVLDLHEGEVEEKINRILEAVSEGKLSVKQGQELMKLIQGGQDIVDVKILLAALEKNGF